MWKIAHLTLATVLVAGAGCGLFSREDRENEDTRGRDVPVAAAVVEEGRDELSYRLQQRGTVYLYDASIDKLLGEFEMTKGERFTFNPQKKRALVDGNPVSVDKVENGNRHRIYFLPADR